MTDAMRHSLRSKVAHAAELLHSQGPVSTFIHTNPLHSLEHLSFEDAVREAERLMGGQGYLSNEEYRQYFRSGRITLDDVRFAIEQDRRESQAPTVTAIHGRRIEERDIRLLHLLYGIEALPPESLRWQIVHAGATRKLRADVPQDTREMLLDKVRTELRVSLDRVGREWTVSEWVQVHTNLDLPGHLRESLCRELHGEWDAEPQGVVSKRHRLAEKIAMWLDFIEIPEDRRETYRKCIDRQLFNVGIYATDRRDELHLRWLKAEAHLLGELVPRHLGPQGTFVSISRYFEHNVEVYATLSLWNAALACRGLNDPLSMTNPQLLHHEDQADSATTSIYERVMAVERDEGLAIPLTANLKAAIETEVGYWGRRQQRREVLLALLGKAKEVTPNAIPPLTVTRRGQSLLARKPSGVGYSSTLARLIGELQMHRGFWWETWDEVMAHPLLISTKPIDAEAYRILLRDELRVCVADEIRAVLIEKYGSQRQDPAAEQRRMTILAGLLEDGLTLQAWEALREDSLHWRDGSQVVNGDGLEEERLCRLVLEGLRPTELTRSAFQALENLVTLRGRASAGLQLLADLRKLDPRKKMIKTAHKILAEKMAHLGQDLTLSDFLRRMTGRDLTAQVNHYMIKWCGAFLDEGLAAWSMPGREQGFYAAWKALGEHDWSFALAGIRGWREAVRNLPQRADDALIATLHTLGITEDHWSDYLARRLVQLPGWAGLIKWREHHPLHPSQKHQHIDLVEYLAVRLFCESLLIKNVCRTVWGLDGTARGLHHLFRAHPSEFMVRREFSLGGLPNYLVERAQSLVRKNPQGQNREEWIRLAEMIWVYRESQVVGHSSTHTLCLNAWRLFHLAQFLGLTAQEIGALSVFDTEQLLAVLDRFPSSEHSQIWLRAYEHHYQNRLLDDLSDNRRRARRDHRPPSAQLVFCIDEREESLRRHIEAQDSSYETFGTAGFFGIAMNYSGLGQQKITPLCPVVVTPVHRILEVAAVDGGRSRVFETRHKGVKMFKDLFKTLKGNQLTSYFLIDLTGFVLGLILIGKTLLPRRFAIAIDRLRMWAVPRPKTALLLDVATPSSHAPGSERLGYSLDEQTAIVEGQLRMMGLTTNFACLVLIFGHGSTSQNNPHESAHDCGACGGKHGGPNARAFATMANAPEVRFALRQRGIDIPQDTYFVGAQHNTASDGIAYFDTHRLPSSHREKLERLVRDLDHARALNAKERCRLLPMAPKQASPERSLRHMERRSVDFTQVHPEWGHATNASVVVGRRCLTQGLFLDRRTFLQSYDPAQDTDGSILERILTAVVPVAAGISLEYYFSRVDNRRYGCGTKVPHNITGLIGVMDGAQSDLRIGLPWQMIWVHEPMRLTFVLEAAPAIVQAIIHKHRALQKLFDHHWAHLIVLDVYSGRFLRYEQRGHGKSVLELVNRM